MASCDRCARDSAAPTDLADPLLPRRGGGRRGGLPRKEVIQPHLPVRLPCYDFVPITGLALGGGRWARRLQAPPAFVT